MAETLSCEIEGLKTEGVVKHSPRLCRTKAHQDDARGDLDYIKSRELLLQIASAGKALQDHAVISVPVEPSPMVGK